MPTPFIDTLVNGQLTQALHPNQYGVPIQNLEAGISFFQVASGPANTYQVTFPPPMVISAYNQGQLVSFLSNGANTGPATLQVNALAPQPITKNGSTPLAGGEIASGMVVTVVFDGAQFQMVSGIAGIMGGVATFNGRSGAVLPATDDYSFAQLAGVAAATQGGTGQDTFNVGDLLVADSSTSLAREPVGPDGQVLTADSTQPTGLTWSPVPVVNNAPFLRPAYTVSTGLSTAAGSLNPVVCTETSPPILAVIADNFQLVYFFYREGGRWRPVGSSGIGTEHVGDSIYSMTGPADPLNPTGTSPRGILYVPSSIGGGPGKGRFWITSATNNYIRVVNPNNLTYTDYAIGDSTYDVANYQALVYSLDLDKVYVIMGGGTKVARINADTVAFEAVQSGLTNLSNLGLQIDGGVTGKVWVTTTTPSLQWLDPSSMAATNTGFSPGYALGALVYMPEVSALFVSATGSAGAFWIVLASSPYTELLSGASGDSTSCYQLAYLPDQGMVVRAETSNVYGFDRVTGTIVATVNRSNILAPGEPLGFTAVTYEPSYGEFYFGYGADGSGFAVAT